MTTQFVDTNALQVALETIFDEDRLTQSQRNKAEMEALVRKWAWFMGDRVKVGDKVFEMQPIAPKLWPLMAMMFENQCRANPQPRTLFEATTTSNVSLPQKYTLPVIREIFPKLIMSKICSIQPMPPSSGGVAKCFWWKTYREDVTPNTQLTATDSDYAVSAEGAVPKRLKGALSSAPVTAIVDKLAASWSQELEEDLLGAMGINIESEMLQAMGSEILRELEERVLNEILSNAGAGNTNWSSTVASGYIAQEWYETIYHAILDSEKLVRTYRHERTEFIVCGLNFVTFLLKTQRFQAKEAGEDVSGPLASGVRFEGTFGKRWDVYSTPYINTNKGILSYYPRSMLHAGYIWMPYVPLMPMPKVYADMRPFNDTDLPGGLVNTDHWTRNVRTRYGKYMCEPTMFATVTIT